MDGAQAVLKEIMGEGAVVGDPAVVRVLENALGLARAGKLRGVAIIQVMGPEQIGLEIAGGHMPAMVTGAVQLQRMITEQMFNPRRGPGILVPGGRG